MGTVGDTKVGANEANSDPGEVRTGRPEGMPQCNTPCSPPAFHDVCVQQRKRSLNENSNFSKTCLSQFDERDETNRSLGTCQAVPERPTHFPGNDSTVRLPKVGGCRKAWWGWRQLLAGSRAATIKANRHPPARTAACMVEGSHGPHSQRLHQRNRGRTRS
jgi:hypothetical protein